MTPAPFDPFDPEALGETLPLEDIEELHPRLTLVRPFLGSLKRAPWFAKLGEAPDGEIRSQAQHYVDGLGFPEAMLAVVESWDDAASAAASLDWDTEAWEAEEQIRAALTQEAVESLGEEALELTLTHVAAELAPPIRSGAEEAAALWEAGETGVVNAAVGTAVQTCHLAALTLLTGRAEDGHPFAAKLTLFELGRWPIAIAGTTFNLF